MPFTQGVAGRDHNGGTFVTWLAGAGIKAGAAYGESDEFGYQAAERQDATATTCTPPSCTCWASTTNG